MKTFQEFATEAYAIEEGMSLKDYKKKRSALKQKEKRAADKIAPNRRKDIHTDRLSPERAARHRANVDPDFEGNDERNYPGGKLNPKKVRKAKALGELGESAAGDVADRAAKLERQKKGQTPERQEMYRKLKNKARSREEEPETIKRHQSLGHKGGGTFGAGGHMRTGMTQSDRDRNREAAATKSRRLSPYDPKYKKHTEGSGTVTKNPKKLRKQQAMGEIGEGIGMTMANALGSPPPLSKRMVLKQALIINKIRSDAKKNKEKKYSGKAANEEYDLSETSLNRVRSKSEKGGMAIMSAQRGDKSKSENKARSRQLERDIRGAGLPGPTKVSGRYTENPGTSQEKKVGEKSHVVSSGKMGKRKFKKAITKLGKKYNQDSVLIQKKPKGPAQLVGTNKSWPGEGKRVKVGKMNPGKTGEFDTKVKNKTFTYEEHEI